MNFTRKKHSISVILRSLRQSDGNFQYGALGPTDVSSWMGEVVRSHGVVGQSNYGPVLQCHELRP